jgi:hypothetical protein
MVKVHFWSQIGLMLSWGTNYANRPYICLDLPFVSIQIFLAKK